MGGFFDGIKRVFFCDIALSSVSILAWLFVLDHASYQTEEDCEIVGNGTRSLH